MKKTKLIFWIFVVVCLCHVLPIAVGYSMKAISLDLEDFLSYNFIMDWMTVTGLIGWFCGMFLIYVLGKEEKKQPINWLVAAIIAVLPFPILVWASEGYGIFIITGFTWLFLSIVLLFVATVIFRKGKKAPTQNS